MLQHVNTVIVGNSVVTTTPTAGQIVVLDEAGNIVSSAAVAAATDLISIAECTGTMQIVDPSSTDGTMLTVPTYKQSSVIQRGMINIEADSYSAPVMAVEVIDLSAATIELGNRYVIRIVYNDLYEDCSQFTHTYEVIASSTLATDLIASFASKINRHANRRVTASITGSVLTLTALDKTDNDGVDSINEYTIVSMSVSLYQTNPIAGLMSNQPYAVVGATLTYTEGDPGKGYWKQVRDMEARAAGYGGQNYRGAWPTQETPKQVVAGTEYNYVTVEYDNKYVSNDNQYIKTTPLTVDIFCAGATTTLVAMLEAFRTGSAA